MQVDAGDISISSTPPPYQQILHESPKHTHTNNTNKHHISPPSSTFKGEPNSHPQPHPPPPCTTTCSVSKPSSPIPPISTKPTQGQSVVAEQPLYHSIGRFTRSVKHSVGNRHPTINTATPSFFLILQSVSSSFHQGSG